MLDQLEQLAVAYKSIRLAVGKKTEEFEDLANAYNELAKLHHNYAEALDTIEDETDTVLRGLPDDITCKKIKNIIMAARTGNTNDVKEQALMMLHGAKKDTRLILAEVELSQTRKELKQLKTKLIEYDDALDTIKHLCNKHNAGEKIVYAQEILDIIENIKGAENDR